MPQEPLQELFIVITRKKKEKTNEKSIKIQKVLQKYIFFYFFFNIERF